MLIITVVEFGLQTAVRSFITTNSTVVLCAAFLTLILAYASYVALIRYGEQRYANELAPRHAVRELLLGVLAGVVLISAVMAVLFAVGVASFHQQLWTDWAHDVREALGTGFLEELLARLIIFRLLSCAFGIHAGTILSAFLFGVAHLHNPNATLLSGMAIAVEAGLLFSGFYIATGRIWMSIGAHAGWNFTLGALFGARVSGMSSDDSLLRTSFDPSAPTWLTGGTFGPEASIVTIVFGLATFVTTLALSRRHATRHGRDAGTLAASGQTGG
ncbi:hypothetical protein GCM10023158_08610 [Gluconacetobacter tumulicola]